MSDRFYAPVNLAVPAVQLEGPEAHHLTAVLRLQPGDMVTLFDGRGTEAAAHIEAVTKRHVALHVVSSRLTEPETPPQLVLATAVPRGDRFRWLVEKATELGVDRLIPLETARSVVDPRESKLDKLRQTVVAACKQCGRNRLMEIAPLTPWDDFVTASAGACSDSVALIVAHPGGDTWSGIAPRFRPEATRIVAIGPEGGLTAPEVDSARQVGAVITSLGPFLLRIETAAIALASAIRLEQRPHPSGSFGQPRCVGEGAKQRET